MDTRVSFKLAKQRLDYYTCPFGILRCWVIGLLGQQAATLRYAARCVTIKATHILIEQLNYPIPSNTHVIYKTGQCLRNHTVVNADGYTCFVQSGEAKIGLLHLSIRYYTLLQVA